MVESAGLREARRSLTARKITLCAQRLADEHGFDGFTMEDLAEAATVSRRTLFNYYPSKTDAVMGSHEPDLAAMEIFRAKGPHGVLIDDLGALVTSMLETKAIDRDEAARVRRLFRASPRLLAAAHESIGKFADLFVEEMVQREDGAIDHTDAGILVRVVLSIFDLTLDTFIVNVDDASLSDLYAEHFKRLRHLFA
jgi:AcrR family transcriptional regulator